jgi:glutathione synthase/RimK-type ligase-like ATP-grasp enzyme
MNILILGNSQDVHAVAIQQALTAAGVKADYLDSSLFPQYIKLSWQPGTETGSLVLPSGELLKFTDIHSVYWRTIFGVGIPSLPDAQQLRIASNDAMGALRSFMQACPARWVNSWSAYQLHKEKPRQLGMVKNMGVTIPKTLISNDQAEIIDFAGILEKAIFKPVYGGAHTQVLTPEHLNPQRLDLVLRIAPVTIQEYIPGTNIRSYVIGSSIYSAEISSPQLDFREDSEAQLIPVELPAAIEQQCLDIVKVLMLEWSAIDWRLTPDGEYVFLEANPSPMFLHFEKQTGFPITQRLVELLMQ